MYSIVYKFNDYIGGNPPMLRDMTMREYESYLGLNRGVKRIFISVDVFIYFIF